MTRTVESRKQADVRMVLERRRRKREEEEQEEQQEEQEEGEEEEGWRNTREHRCLNCKQGGKQCKRRTRTLG